MLHYYLLHVDSTVPQSVEHGYLASPLHHFRPVLLALSNLRYWSAPHSLDESSECLLNIVRHVLAKPHCHRAVRMSVVSALRTGATVGPCGTAAGIHRCHFAITKVVVLLLSTP
jgi:hypothetical protein